VLDVKMPSVTAAMKKLSEEGLVEHEKYGYVRLTRKGKPIANEVLHRHVTLQHFLEDIIGMDAETAQTDACRIEHAISAATLERLSKFVEFVSLCPSGQPEWLKGFKYYFEKGEHNPYCMAQCQGSKQLLRLGLSATADKT
jgi:DtxR family Mn-dependent transcriptional regulator